MEQWKDIPGYVGFYQVSNEGRVRSLIRLLPSAIEQGIRREKLILAFGKNKQGRLQVTLCKEGFTKRFQVHRLVLETFTGPAPEGTECRHLDGDHTNNHEGNLVWGTHTENMQDKTAHGTQLFGERNPAGRAKLTENDVKEIRASSATERALAAQYGVSQVSIHFIRTRKTWKHIP